MAEDTDGIEDYKIRKANKKKNKKASGIRGGYDYKTRFIYDPNLGGLGFEEDKHKHINKNIIVTNLSRKDNEPQKARGYLQGIQLLRHYDKKEYFEIFEDENGELKKREVSKEYYENLPEEKRMKRITNKFQPALDQKHGELYALTSVASGTHAGLMRTAETQHVKQEKTIRQDLESGKRDFDRGSTNNGYNNQRSRRR